MRHNINTLLFILLCGIISSCSNDEDKTPSMADSDRLETLIDASNKDITDFKNDYGTYLLYDFDDMLDFAYQFEEASAWRSAVIERLDKSDVQQAVDFLKSSFLPVYSDDFIRKWFPRKLLMCKSIYAGTLGLSTVTSKTYHCATASLNSVAIAKLDKATLNGMSESEIDAYLKQIHYMYIAGYLVNSRNNLFVEKEFYNFTSTLYSSLIDENRLQVSNFNDEFFYDKGFFKPLSDSDTYYCNQQDDLISYIRNLIFMTQASHDKLLKYSIMTQKLKIVVRGLEDLGIHVEMINPLVKDFITNIN